jgi:hypothetical protein
LQQISAGKELRFPESHPCEINFAFPYFLRTLTQHVFSGGIEPDLYTKDILFESQADYEN